MLGLADDEMHRLYREPQWSAVCLLLSPLLVSQKYVRFTSSQARIKRLGGPAPDGTQRVTLEALPGLKTRAWSETNLREVSRRFDEHEPDILHLSSFVVAGQHRHPPGGWEVFFEMTTIDRLANSRWDQEVRLLLAARVVHRLGREQVSAPIIKLAGLANAVRRATAGDYHARPDGERDSARFAHRWQLRAAP